MSVRNKIGGVCSYPSRVQNERCFFMSVLFPSLRTLVKQSRAEGSAKTNGIAASPSAPRNDVFGFLSLLPAMASISC